MALRIGLLGAGRIGKVHASAIGATEGAVLTAVADAFPDAAAGVAAAHGADVASIDDILADRDIDAVFITTPTDMHADLIIRSAHAGKAIFCEKPIDLDVARVTECLSAVATTSTTLMVGFNRRFDPNFRAVRDRIDAGDIGAVEMVVITSRDPGPPSRVHGTVRRTAARHDHPRSRHGALPPRRGAHRGVRRRLSPR